MENSNLIYKLIAGTFHLHNGAGRSSNAWYWWSSFIRKAAMEAGAAPHIIKAETV